MHIHKEPSSETFIVEMSRDQLALINNALNEICNGISIDEREFSSRLGASRAAALEMLAEVGRALD